jgi:hypothetical protein
MTTMIERPGDPAAVAAWADDPDHAFESARAAAHKLVLELADRQGGVPLREAYEVDSGDRHATARAIVRLLSSGDLLLTHDRRLVRRGGQ